MVVVVFFFFCCDRCLKGLWIVVGSSVWVVVGCLGLKRWIYWSSVAPMVALVMIFFEWVCSGGFQIGWVSNRRHGFADRWLGWWVWWPLLAPTGLMVFVCVFCVWLFVSSGFLIWVCGVFHWFLINFDIWLSRLLSFPEFYRVYFVVYCLFPLIFSSGCGFFDWLVVDFVFFLDWFWYLAMWASFISCIV